MSRRSYVPTTVTSSRWKMPWYTVTDSFIRVGERVFRTYFVNMPTAPIYAKFGLVLRKRREAAGLSQRQLAAITGHQRTHIGLIEQGIQNPSLTLADDLARALRTSLSQMIMEAQQLRGRGIGGPLKPGRKARSQ